MIKITVTINGRKVKAQKGATVLEIAQASGIRIPTLCHHKDLSPYGGCRLCIVEVKGTRNPLTACTLVAEHGMVVKTDTERVRKLRRATLQLILSEHPNACLVCEREGDCNNFQECIKKSAVTFGCKSCPKNNECELQDLARELGIKDIPFEFRYRNLEPQRNDPFFDRDYNLCVLCGRCVRVCEEIRHASTLEFHHRGPDTMVGTAFDLPHLESGCQFCGACVDVCPTGALRDRFSRYDRPPDRKMRTTCLLCNMGCAIDLNVAGDKVTCTTPHRSQICVRGRFGIAPLVHHPKRITKPLVKKEHGLVEVEWDEALDFAAQKLREHHNRTGMLLSSQLTSEAIDRAYSLCDRSKAVIAVPAAPVEGLTPLQFRKIERNAAFIVINTDLVADYPVLLLGLRRKFKDSKKFIVINALAHATDRYADTVLNPKPGTAHEVLDALVGTRTRRVPKKCGITADEIDGARCLLKDRPCYVLYDVANFALARPVKSVKRLCLSAIPNGLKICRMGFDRTPDQLLSSDRIDCLYLVGSAPFLRRKYQTVIVQDSFLPGFDFDVFLPAATFVELDGTMVDIEGKKKRVHRAVEPAGRSRSDEWIFGRLAQAMSMKPGKKKKRKMAKSKPMPRIHTSRAYPLQLIVRENTHLYRGRPLSSLLTGFQRLRRDRSAWFNERTARKYNLHDGALAKIANHEISFELPVRISQEVPDGAVLIFAHPSLSRIKDQRVRLECSKS
ncbi:(2Fe-2S)-binding protein [candidate division WOR-3 bacterium]|nr:(2Fe-2S)-binding protein [candidate division WOR-3 bacterium]